MKTNPVVSIISPYPVAAEGYSSILKEYVSKTDVYYSAVDFLNWYQGNSSETDLVIIDSNIGVLIVEMMTWELSQKRPDLKTLVIASETDTFSSKSFLYSGVKGILNKHASTQEILTAISKVLSNDHYFSPGIQYKLLQGILSRQKYMETLRKDYNLSEKELMIIRMVCVQKKSKDIASVLSLSQRTVEGMRAKILRKLRLENGVGLVLFGLKHNLLDINDAKEAA
jgi:DNA-binding NarL/FixJ family response regulator